MSAQQTLCRAGGAEARNCVSPEGENAPLRNTIGNRKRFGNLWNSKTAASDARDLIRKHATTRDAYLKVRWKIPLRALFDRFHLEAAAEFVRELGQVGAEAVGRPILLSANAWVVEERHRVVAPHLTHIVCEAEFQAQKGTADLSRALPDFEVGRSMGKPVVVCASGGDYALVKATGAEDLVRFWIAVTYAHGQWFMVPHPKRQWCFTKELGTHWYAAPAGAYAPLYRFIRTNARWFDGFEPTDAGGITVPENVLCTVRRKGEKGPIVLHLVNRDYDAQARRMRPAKDVSIKGLSTLANKGGRVRLLAYDAEPETVETSTEGGTTQIKVPELRLWTLVVIE
ncbi:MAG TPA: hypothetical protein VM431_02585 [Phycisphaerae bacterium]|nr:hypothetical protein [Phycisphaerae bacterium]